MTSSVSNSEWELIDYINSQILEEKKAVNSAAQRLSGNKQVAKKNRPTQDAIVSRSQSGLREEAVLSKGNLNSKPELPNPSNPWTGEGMQKEPGLIAIIGAVLMLQAKANSNFWKVMWKQASQCMMIQVKFAPIIAKATIASADAQAAATSADAEKNEWDGFINLAMFGASVVMAGAMEIKKPEEDAADTQTEFRGETQPNITTTAEKNALAEDEEITNQAAEDQENSTYENIRGKGKSALNAQKKGQAGLMGFLVKLAGAAQGISLLANGSTQLVNWQYESKQANEQQKKGVDDALAEKGKAYQTFYGQGYSQQTSLAENAQQAFQYGLNIWKSASDAVTSAVVKMFG